jgi:signal peptidase
MMRLAINAVSTFIVVITFGLVLLATAPLLFGYGSVVVVSGSMEPSIQVGDVVLTTATDASHLGIGTVINVRTPASLRLHRITAVIADGYRTKGDANGSPDSDPVTPRQIAGVGFLLVPFVGLPRVWIDHGDWLRLATCLCVLILALHTSRRAWLQPSQAWSDT